jgi:hypothetical protein
MWFPNDNVSNTATEWFEAVNTLVPVDVVIAPNGNILQHLGLKLFQSAAFEAKGKTYNVLQNPELLAGHTLNRALYHAMREALPPSAAPNPKPAVHLTPEEMGKRTRTIKLSNMPPNAKKLAWLVQYHAVTTGEMLWKRNIEAQMHCPLCDRHDEGETIQHLFADCPSIQDARHAICEMFPSLYGPIWRDAHPEYYPSISDPVALELLGIFQFVIWKCRCEVVFSDTTFVGKTIADRVLNTLRDHVILLDYARACNWHALNIDTVVNDLKAFCAAHNVEYPSFDLPHA